MNKSFQVVHSPKSSEFDILCNYDYYLDNCRLFGNGKILYKTKYNKFNIVENIRSPLPIDYEQNSNNNVSFLNKDGVWISAENFVMPSTIQYDDDIFILKGNKYCLILSYSPNFSLHIINVCTSDSSEIAVDSFLSPDLKHITENYDSFNAIITNNDASIEHKLIHGFVRQLHSIIPPIPDYLIKFICKFFSKEIVYCIINFNDRNIVFYFTIDSLFSFFRVQ